MLEQLPQPSLAKLPPPPPPVAPPFITKPEPPERRRRTAPPQVGHSVSLPSEIDC